MKPEENPTWEYEVYVPLQSTYLRGVLGLPTIRRGERIFGSNENFSLMFSRTDGATYVKPYKDIRDKTLVHGQIRAVGCRQGEREEQMIDYWVRRSSTEADETGHGAPLVPCY